MEIMAASSDCPYCGGITFSSVTTEEARHPLHTVVQCDSCDGYSIKHRNGYFYPLSDRTNKESDAVLRVIDDGYA